MSKSYLLRPFVTCFFPINQYLSQPSTRKPVPFKSPSIPPLNTRQMHCASSPLLQSYSLQLPALHLTFSGPAHSSLSVKSFQTPITLSLFHSLCSHILCTAQVVPGYVLYFTCLGLIIYHTQCSIWLYIPFFLIVLGLVNQIIICSYN